MGVLSFYFPLDNDGFGGGRGGEGLTVALSRINDGRINFTWFWLKFDYLCSS